MYNNFILRWYDWSVTNTQAADHKENALEHIRKSFVFIFNDVSRQLS